MVGSTNELNDSKCYIITLHPQISCQIGSQLLKIAPLSKISNIKTKKINMKTKKKINTKKIAPTYRG